MPTQYVTRLNAKVDRIACPWLISRFVDPKADFLFVPEADVAHIVQETGAIPFDMPGVELGHVSGRCTFESIMHKYRLTDPGLREMAKIVHAADISDDLSTAPQAAGLQAIAFGFAMLYGDNDFKKMLHEFPMYDALYAWCKGKAEAGR